MRIKTKLSVGTGFLFCVILVFGLLSVITVNRLKSDSGRILKNNYETLVYANRMLDVLDAMNADGQAYKVFEENLRKQEVNITESGEAAATRLVRSNFDALKSAPSNEVLKKNIRESINDINDINHAAILRKNTQASRTAETANTWLVIIFSVLVLVTFTMAVNFPGVISRPIVALNEAIGAIVRKDYTKRIHLDQRDEFGELANAFNMMADKLNEYEHSNLAKIMFEKSRIETVINQMSDGIIGLDEKKNILFINGVAQSLLGLKETDFAGRKAEELASRNDLLHILLKGDRPKAPLKIFADNKESYFSEDVLTVRNSGEAIGEVIILRNITAFRELDEAKTNFIATVSHELKTPIAAIKISTSLLADKRVGTLNEEQGSLVGSIQDDANRLLKITSELLNLSQVETGQIQLHIEPVPCEEIAAPARLAVEHLLKDKGIILRQQLPAGSPMVLADKEKTSWVLINFLTNAIKHSPDGAEILFSVSLEGRSARFLVTDHGHGIEAAYLPRVFERYFRIPGAGEPPGSGLGLSIAKEFITAQSGKVSVESVVGSGSTFGFELPLAG